MKAVFEKARAWIELDEKALRNNIEILRKLLPEGGRLMPAVKANAYGHGNAFITRVMQDAGITDFCVACVDEAVEMRENGIKGDILTSDIQILRSSIFFISTT